MYLHLSTMSTWNYSDSTTFHSLSWILRWCRASCSLRKGTNPTFNSPLGLCLSMLNHWRICNSITSLYPAIHDMCRIYQRCQSWQHFNFRIFQSFPSLPDSVRISGRQNKVNKGTVLEHIGTVLYKENILWGCSLSKLLPRPPRPPRPYIWHIW